MQPAVGTKVGRFQLVRPLETDDGRLIWLGSHDAFGTMELAAIDLPVGDAPEPERAAAVRQEAEIAQHLRHEGILRVLEVGEIDGQVWIAREFVEGTTLARLTEALEALRQTNDPLRLACIAHIIASVLEILAHTHAIRTPNLSFGVAHGQLTAHEILVSNRGTIKAAGFGIDRRPSDGTAGLMTMGALRSMAPELLVGIDLQPPADLYATGILLHTLLDGQEPHSGLGAAELYQAILGGTQLKLQHPAPPELATLHAALTVSDMRQRITAAAALEQLQRSTVSRPDASRELGKLVSGVLNPVPERDLFDQLSATSSELRAPPSAAMHASAMTPPAPTPPAASRPPANVQAPPQHLPFAPPAAARPPASVHAPPQHLPIPQPSPPPVAAPPTIHPSAAPPLLGMPPVAEDEGTAMIDPDMLARMREAARQAGRPPAAAAQSPASSPAPAAPVAPPTIAPPISPRPAPAASSSPRPARPLHDLPPGLIRNSAPSSQRPAPPPAFVSPTPSSAAAGRPTSAPAHARASSSAAPPQPRRPPFEIPQQVGEGTTTAMLVRRERRSLALTIVIGTLVAITLGATIAYLIIA